MDYTVITQDIKAKRLSPLYLLHGEESYFIDLITESFLNDALTEDQKEFDLSVMYGKDTDVNTLVSVVKRYPMMSPFHLVILREAQDMKKLEEMEALFTHPVQSTVLVISHKGKVDGRKKWAKAFAKNGVSFHSEKVKEWDLGKWVSKEAKAKGLQMDVKAAEMLVEFVGDDLSRMSHNLDKLCMMAKKGEKVDADLVEKVIGVSKEYNIFELQDALMNRDAYKAQRIVKFFNSDPKNHAIPMVVATLFGLYAKLILVHAHKAFDQNSAAKVLKTKPFYAGKVAAGARKYSYGELVGCISVLRDYDMKSKGVGATNDTSKGELMKEMIFKLTH
jgi:DNA polymerase-3 subunit delta